jgi:hypothetical protein
VAFDDGEGEGGGGGGGSSRRRQLEVAADNRLWHWAVVGVEFVLFLMETELWVLVRSGGDRERRSGGLSIHPRKCTYIGIVLIVGANIIAQTPISLHTKFTARLSS